MSALFVKCVIFCVDPGNDFNEIGDKARNNAFHQGIISHNDILITGLRTVLLMYD